MPANDAPKGLQHLLHRSLATTRLDGPRFPVNIIESQHGPQGRTECQRFIVDGFLVFRGGVINSGGGKHPPIFFLLGTLRIILRYFIVIIVGIVKMIRQCSFLAAAPKSGRFFVIRGAFGGGIIRKVVKVIVLGQRVRPGSRRSAGPFGHVVVYCSGRSKSLVDGLVGSCRGAEPPNEHATIIW